MPAFEQGERSTEETPDSNTSGNSGKDGGSRDSDPLAHAAVGILPGSGTALHHGGRARRYTELSTEGWPVGIIPPQYGKPRSWTVLPLSTHPALD